MVTVRTEPLRAEHRELVPKLDALRVLAAELDSGTPAVTRSKLDEVVSMMRRDLLPTRGPRKRCCIPRSNVRWTAAGGDGNDDRGSSGDRPSDRRARSVGDCARRPSAAAHTDRGPARSDLGPLGHPATALREGRRHLATHPRRASRRRGCTSTLRRVCERTNTHRDRSVQVLRFARSWVLVPWAEKVLGVDDPRKNGGTMHAKVGDELAVDSTEVGVPPRTGRVLEVRGEAGEEHYLVRWSDGHESLFFPGSTTHAVRAAGHGRD